MKGYVITYSERDDFYIPYALHVEKDTSCNAWMYETHLAASKAARMDGVELIYGMDHVPDGIYLDTEENRQLIKDKLQEFPKYKKLGINLTVEIAKKLRMLKSMKVVLNEDELIEMRNKRSEIAIDNYAKAMMRKYLI